MSLRTEAVEAIRPHLGKETVVLCNKVDLVGTVLDTDGIRKQIMEATGCRACWFVSLTDGTGTEHFVESLSSLLQDR